MNKIMLRSELAGVEVSKKDQRTAMRIIKKHGGKVIAGYDKGAEIEFQSPQSFRAAMKAANLDYLIDDFSH